MKYILTCKAPKNEQRTYPADTKEQALDMIKELYKEGCWDFNLREKGEETK